MIHTTTDSSQAPNLSNDVPIEKSGETLVQDNFIYSEQFEKVMKETEELIQYIKQSYDDRKVDNAFKKVEICEALINNLDNEEEKKKFKELLNKESVIFTDIKEEYKYMKVIVTELDKEEGWNVENDNENYRILYRKIPNTRLYSIRMEADVEIPLINLITLINEVDLWHLWVAFVNKTIEIKALNKGAKVYFVEFGLPYPLSKRMMHVYGAGINRLDENGTVLVVAKSMDHDKDFFTRHDVKKVETKGDVNIDLNLGGFQITPINEHKIKFKAVANVDPNLSWCPDSLINLISRKVAKFILSRMVSYAKKFEGSEWEKETKKPEKKEFYDWLNDQVNQYFEKIKAQKAAESAQQANVEPTKN